MGGSVFSQDAGHGVKLTGQLVEPFGPERLGAVAERMFRIMVHFNLQAVCSGGDGTMNETVAGMVRGGVSAPVVLGTVAVTAVAVGGAVYVCSDTGAEGAALDAAPVAEVEPDQAVSGLPMDAPPEAATPPMAP